MIISFQSHSHWYSRFTFLSERMPRRFCRQAREVDSAIKLAKSVGLDPANTTALCVEDGRVCHAEVLDRSVPTVHTHRATKWIEVAA